MVQARSLLCILSGGLLLLGQTPAKGPAETAQALFDAMLKHDGEGGKALFTPEATLTSLRPDGKMTVTTAEQFLARIAGSKDTLLERMWEPQVLQRGSLAVIWAPYDFHLNGKFHHCGIDSFTLIKGDAGWKISGITYTTETAGCAPSPLGPPATR